MFRYKVKYYDFFNDGPDVYAKKVEDDMNNMAANGWKVISVVTSTRTYGHMVTYEIREEQVMRENAR